MAVIVPASALTILLSAMVKVSLPSQASVSLVVVTGKVAVVAPAAMVTD